MSVCVKLILALFWYHQRLNSWLLLQSPPSPDGDATRTRTNILVREAIMLNVKGKFILKTDELKLTVMRTAKSSDYHSLSSSECHYLSARLRQRKLEYRIY
jgi:hypothetical protein